jgi:hypothetical protein
VIGSLFSLYVFSIKKLRINALIPARQPDRCNGPLAQKSGQPCGHRREGDKQDEQQKTHEDVGNHCAENIAMVTCGGATPFMVMSNKPYGGSTGYFLLMKQLL